MYPPSSGPPSGNEGPTPSPSLVRGVNQFKTKSYAASSPKSKRKGSKRRLDVYGPDEYKADYSNIADDDVLAKSDSQIQFPSGIKAEILSKQREITPETFIKKQRLSTNTAANTKKNICNKGRKRKFQTA
ncbi:MAG: hypothetical protein Sylvanvirus11_9 [Sylvanvirus sp.]|uniref:Uncharacterized protein n=1 Tax=Sylvanvirus sp. TaxID=2487774 RepID=A0A3G5AI53_9VIRU|nr:MAG: hypothetical protein Sylvanvirus11_9 [Sylvanvirus sp.]